MIKKEKIDWQKGDGLVPAIVQDKVTRRVLMLGYMNEKAFDQTIETGLVTFFSRLQNKIWVKGETSGNLLSLEEIKIDCDSDTLLVLARPAGPVCHKGTDTCFEQENDASFSFLSQLEGIIEARGKASPKDSYVAQLLAEGISRMAQKVGEEGVEVALAAVEGKKEKIREEAADLLFHLLVLLRASGLELADINATLAARHGKKN